VSGKLFSQFYNLFSWETNAFHLDNIPIFFLTISNNWHF